MRGQILSTFTSHHRLISKSSACCHETPSWNTTLALTIGSLLKWSLGYVVITVGSVVGHVFPFPVFFPRTSQLHPLERSTGVQLIARTRHVHKVARQVRSSLTCHKDAPPPSHPSPIQTTFSTNFGILFPPSYRGPGDARPFCASLHRTSICTFVLLNLRPIFSSSINQFDLLWKRN